MSTAAKLGNTMSKTGKSKTLTAAGKSMIGGNDQKNNFPTDAEIEAF
jgi:hypothetical protein